MQKRNSIEVKDVVSTALASITFLVSAVYLLFTSPPEITSTMLITFGIIVVVILFGSVFIYFFSRWNILKRDIAESNNSLEEIHKSLNLQKLFNDMDVRLRVLEELIKSKSKKGFIDPRIFYWIILIVLLLLFLKFAGLFG